MTFSLPRKRSTTEPRRQIHPELCRRVLGAGFEPAEPFRTTVLQTVAIDHSAIPAPLEV